MASSDTAGPSGAQIASSVQKQPTPILRKTSKRQLTVSDTSDSDTSSIRKSKRTLKKKSQKSQTIVEKVRSTEGYTDYQDSGVVGESNEGAEYSQDQPREMTVLQAENAENSDSE